MAVIDKTSSEVSGKNSGVKKTSLKTLKKSREDQRPSTVTMVINAIKTLQDRQGSSLQAIKKFIAANYTVDMNRTAPYVCRYLRVAVEKTILHQTKGVGANGRFKLHPLYKKDEDVKKPKIQKSPKSKETATKKIVDKVTKPKVVKSNSKPKTATESRKARNATKNTEKSAAKVIKLPKSLKTSTTVKKDAKKVTKSTNNSSTAQKSTKSPKTKALKSTKSTERTPAQKAINSPKVKVSSKTTGMSASQKLKKSPKMKKLYKTAPKKR